MPQKMPRVGAMVRVRRQRWSVLAVRPYETCEVVTLGGRDTRNLGATRHFIAPFDDIETIQSERTLRVVGIARWRRALRAQLQREGPAGRLAAAAGAQIELFAYQLEPALAIVRGLGCRLLLADEVGLGKTIQAGLIVSELLARGAAERVLVLTPAGLREQWTHELKTRFALEAQLVDIATLRRRTAELPVGINPWTTVPIAIASLDFVKRPEVAPAAAAAHWDIVIIDEAHGVTPGSDRHACADEVCGLSPYVILLTATPHNGNRAAFESMCALGSRNDGPILVFRRSRRDVGLACERRIHQVYIRPNAAERRMYGALSALARAITSDKSAADPSLALTVLHKRAFSSARSLEQSVVRSMSALPVTEGEGVWQPGLPLDDPDGELDSRDQPPSWGVETFGTGADTRRCLRDVAEAARAAAADETKLTRLRRLIARLGEPAIVFTEYRDTLSHVRSVLRLDAALLHGGLSAHERHAALDSFASGRRRVLLATDAAGEGLNLHHTCRVVINLELPWSPTRIEQRIGRVDRIGQRRRVHVFHLIARDTGEMRLLDFLRRKIARAREDIPAADPLGEFESEPADREELIAWTIVKGDTR